MDNKEQLATIFNAGVQAVEGYQAIKAALTKRPDYKPDLIISVGKAASGMCAGALDSCLRPCPAILVTKYHHTDESMHDKSNVTVYETAHPIPDENSLSAGLALIKAIENLSRDSELLLLVSGGASSLAEHLPSDISLQEWQELTNRMISSGMDIDRINKKRKEISLIKDGKLLENYKGNSVTVLAISDVEGDDISTIGSGIGNINKVPTSVKSELEIIASNTVARNACVQKALDLGLEVRRNSENLYGDVSSLASNISKQLLMSSSGVYIFGGEPTINLPKDPGNGGRNQSLALEIALQIKGTRNIAVLVAGTDGTDGPTNAAGGIINGQSVKNAQQALSALKKADAGSYLRKTGDIFITGPTNTNVMDLLIAIVD